MVSILSDIKIYISHVQVDYRIKLLPFSFYISYSGTGFVLDVLDKVWMS